METFDHLCAAVANWLFWVTPACFFAWLSFRFHGDSVVRLLRLTADFAATVLVVTARAWYVKPDYAGSPIAAVAAAAIVTIPALLGLGSVFLLCTRGKCSAKERAVYSLVTGYVILVLCCIPAVLVFVEMGGDTL